MFIQLRSDSHTDPYSESSERYSRLGSLSVFTGFSPSSPGFLAVPTRAHVQLQPRGVGCFFSSHTYKTTAYDRAEGHESCQRTENKGESGCKTEDKGTESGRIQVTASNSLPQVMQHFFHDNPNIIAFSVCRTAQDPGNQRQRPPSPSW